MSTTPTKFVRTVDWDNPTVERSRGSKVCLLYYGESCMIAAELFPPGAEESGHHVHPSSDQVFVVYEGETAVKLGRAEEKLPKNSAAFIPAGTPHHNWNASDAVATQLAVTAPGPTPVTRAAKPADEAADWNGNGHYVHAVDESVFVGEPANGVMAFDWLASRERGARHASMYLAEVKPGASGPDLHMHDFDQFYFVLEGSLGVQVGRYEFEVGPETLVVLPAGVPHRQWNTGEGPERHIALLVPEPERVHSESDPWDIPVEMKLPPNG